MANHINNHKEQHFGHLFLLAKGNGAGGTDEAGGPDGPAGADQPGELRAGRLGRRGRWGGGGGRGRLGQDLPGGGGEVLDLALDLRRQVGVLGLALGQEGVHLGLDLGQLPRAGRGQDVVDLRPDGGRHVLVVGQLPGVGEEAGDGGAVGGGRSLGRLRQGGQVVGAEGEVGAVGGVDAGREVDAAGQLELGCGGGQAGHGEEHNEGALQSNREVGYVNQATTSKTLSYHDGCVLFSSSACN